MNVRTHKFCFRGAKHRVKQAFEGCYICCGCWNREGIIDVIAPYCEAQTVFFEFVRLYLHTIFPYVALRLQGILLNGMKKIVLVPLGILVPIPLARRPKLVSKTFYPRCFCISIFCWFSIRHYFSCMSIMFIMSKMVFFQKSWPPLTPYFGAKYP